MTVAVLCDIDGTLLRAGDPDHRAAFDEALAAVHGVPATLDGVPLAGRLELGIARAALAPFGISAEDSDARFPEVVAVMAERYAARVAPGSRTERLLPGLPDVLEALVAAGASLAAVTGNAEPVARHKLAAAGLDHLLPCGAYGDATDDRGELVRLGLAAVAAHSGRDHDPATAVVLGDTPRDVAAARDAGCRAVAVATGAAARDALAATDPDVLLDDLSRVDAVVRAVLGG